MDTLSALTRTYEQAEAIVAGTPRAAFDDPTPCTEWDVRTLLNHMVAVLRGFPVVLDGQKANWSADVLGEDAADSFRTAAAANLMAWRLPGAADFPSPKLAGMHLIDVNLVDVLTHTWDLAVATGQATDLDPRVTEHTYELWRDAPLEASREAGAFAPAVQIPPGAPALHRLVALLGRRP
jgi:uncharacterized protein (TIGR03086 family)